MTLLTVAETAVRQDAEGRFCLNDMHRAAGGAMRNRPSYYLAREETKALVAELAAEKAGIPAFCAAPIAVQRGRNGGTFAVQDLVISYAMWISPAFALRVIRAFQRRQNLSQFGNLYAQRVALEARDAGSRERGRIGSQLLHGRRRELEALREARAALEAEMQPLLFTLHVYDLFGEVGPWLRLGTGA